MKWLSQIPLFLLRRPVWFFVLWALWLSLEYWALGGFSYLHIHDNADQIIPVSTWLTETPQKLFGTKLLPEMCGVDRFATTAWINLHRLFCLVMPAWLAHGLFIFIQRFVAGYFTCRLLKEHFNVPPMVAILAGAAYTLINLEHGEMRLMHNLNEPGFPLMIWMLIRLSVSRFGLGLLGAVAGGVFFSLTMGPVGAWPFLFPTSVLVAMILRRDLTEKAQWGKFIGLAVLFGVCCLSLRIPTLLAMAPNAALSHRADWTAYQDFFRQWRHLMSTRPAMVLPWWGVLGFSVLWIFQIRGRGRKDVAVLLLLLIGLFVGPLFKSIAVALKEYVGFLGGFNFTRFDRVLPLALMMAGALGLARLQRIRIGEGAMSFSLSSLLALALLGMAAEHSLSDKRDHLTGIQREGKSWRTLYENPEVRALAKELKGQDVRCVTAGAYHEFHPLYALPQGLELADGYLVMYPNYYQQYWAEVVRPLTDKEPEYFEGHFGWWGSRVYLFHSSRKEHQFIPEIPFDDWYNLDLLSLANVRYIIARKPVEDTRLKLHPQVVTEDVREQWWNLPAKEKVRGYLRGDNPGAPIYIYENTNAVQRFFTTQDAQWFDTDKDLYAHLGGASISNLTTTVCLLTPERGKAHELVVPADAEPAKVTLVGGRDLTVKVLRVQTESPCWLVFSSLYYPWWECTIDSENVQVYRAYGAFMAVQVPEGDHKVRFSYQPPYHVSN